MRKLLAVCVLTLCMVRATFGIQCYTCNSTKSAQECVKRQKLQSCPSNQDQCRTSFITLKTERSDTRQFLKQCSSKAVCDQARAITALCKEYNGTCLERCCNHDSCNKIDGGPSTIKCYQCFSNKSWSDCDRVRKVLPGCRLDEEERCAKLTLTGKRGDQTIGTYSKLCIRGQSCVVDDCGEKFSDPSITTTSCSISCCDFDLCNGATVPMISAIILLACALQAIPPGR